MKIAPLINQATKVLPLTLAFGFALSMGGCASTPVPNERMAVAEAAVARANSTGTSENAASQLLVATTKLERARQAVIDKDNELAAQLAEQVVLDAQVAELHAQSERSRKAAAESKDAARALSEEINRKSAQ